MAIGFRSQAENQANSTSVSVTFPATWQTNDLIIVTLGGNASQLTGLATPSGWVRLTGGIITSGSFSFVVYYKVAGSGDPGSTLTFNTAANGNLSVNAVAYSGVDTAAPVNIGNIVAESSAGTSHVAPTVTSTVAGWVVTGVADRGSPPSTAFTAPASRTIRSDQYPTGGGSVAVAIADSAANVASGSVSGGTWTGTLSTSSAGMFTLVLKPASTAANPATATPYDQLVNHLVNARVDLDTDTIKAALVNGYVFDATDVWWSDVSASEIANGNGYTTGGATLATKVTTTNTTTHVTKWTSDPITWTASGAGIAAATGLVLYKSTGVSSTSPLIGYIDFGGTTGTTASPNVLEVDPDATNGWLTISKG